MRKIEKLTIQEDGRDKGKTFVLTEMPADQAERWAIRALLALTNAGATIPDGGTEAGMAGMATMGFEALGKLPYESVEPLLDEMFDCVRYEHKPGAPLQKIIAGDGSQIEEVRTRLTLRLALFKLHTGFSTAA